MGDDKVRLQKYMAMCGIDSRRHCEKLITSGRVKINSRIANLGDKISIGEDIVEVDEKIIENIEYYEYIAIYKPRGYLSAVIDKYSNKCVTELVKNIEGRLYPVGRLDKDSEGLMLLTNDGNFAYKIMHPSGCIEKTYIVTVNRKITDLELKKLNSIMEIDGEKLLPAKVRVLKRGDRPTLEFVLRQGKNRQIRKMCSKLDLKVLELKRVSIGCIKLLDLKEGEYRRLTKEEINSF